MNHERDTQTEAETSFGILLSVTTRLSNNYRHSSLIPVRGADTQLSDLVRHIDQAAKAKEPVTCILIGERGCGKSLLISHSIKHVQTHHSGVVVALSAKLTIDKLQSRLVTGLIEFRKKLANKKHASCIFCVVLDRFEEFAAKPYMFFYELGTLVQDIPCVIISETCDYNYHRAVDRRAKSRLRFVPIMCSSPSSVDVWVEIMKDALTVTPEQVESLTNCQDENILAKLLSIWNKAVEAATKEKCIRRYLCDIKMTSTVSELLSSLSVILSMIIDINNTPISEDANVRRANSGSAVGLSLFSESLFLHLRTWNKFSLIPYILSYKAYEACRLDISIGERTLLAFACNIQTNDTGTITLPVLLQKCSNLQMLTTNTQIFQNMTQALHDLHCLVEKGLLVSRQSTTDYAAGEFYVNGDSSMISAVLLKQFPHLSEIFAKWIT